MIIDEKDYKKLLRQVLIHASKNYKKIAIVHEVTNYLYSNDLLYHLNFQDIYKSNEKLRIAIGGLYKLFNLSTAKEEEELYPHLASTKNTNIKGEKTSIKGVGKVSDVMFCVAIDFDGVVSQMYLAHLHQLTEEQINTIKSTLNCTLDKITGNVSLLRAL